MIRKNCEYCGDGFKCKSNRRKFCSKSCANSRKRPWRETGKYVNCPICNKRFYASKHLIESENDVYCSKECGVVGSAKKLEKKVVRKCDNCSDEYKTAPSKNKKYCSMECKREGSKNGEHRDCKNCGEIFYTPYSDDQKFCSADCHYESKREIRECLNCGEGFKVRSSDIPQHCSRKCWKENAKTYPNTSYLRNLVRQKWQREDLHDTYVKGRIQQSTSIKLKDIPQELIELKRLNIKRKRIIRNHNQK